MAVRGVLCTCSWTSKWEGGIVPWVVGELCIAECTRRLEVNNYAVETRKEVRVKYCCKILAVSRWHRRSISDSQRL